MPTATEADLERRASEAVVTGRGLSCRGSSRASFVHYVKGGGVVVDKSRRVKANKAQGGRVAGAMTRTGGWTGRARVGIAAEWIRRDGKGDARERRDARKRGKRAGREVARERRKSVCRNETEDRKSVV